MAKAAHRRTFVTSDGSTPLAVDITAQAHDVVTHLALHVALPAQIRATVVTLHGGAVVADHAGIACLFAAVIAIDDTLAARRLVADAAMPLRGTYGPAVAVVLEQTSLGVLDDIQLADDLDLDVFRQQRDSVLDGNRSAPCCCCVRRHHRQTNNRLALRSRGLLCSVTSVAAVTCDASYRGAILNLTSKTF